MNAEPKRGQRSALGALEAHASTVVFGPCGTAQANPPRSVASGSMELPPPTLRAGRLRRMPLDLALGNADMAVHAISLATQAQHLANRGVVGAIAGCLGGRYIANRNSRQQYASTRGGGERYAPQRSGYREGRYVGRSYGGLKGHPRVAFHMIAGSLVMTEHRTDRGTGLRRQ